MKDINSLDIFAFIVLGMLIFTWLVTRSILWSIVGIIVSSFAIIFILASMMSNKKGGDGDGL